jgi:hypothetical protein
MKLTKKATALLIGSMVSIMGVLSSAQTSSAQTTTPRDSDITNTGSLGRTSGAPSVPIAKPEPGAAISENNHLILLPWYNLGTAPDGPWVHGYMKLLTPIVYNENNMFSIKIKGYRYGTSGTPLEIRCGGYAYSGAGLISSDCVTQGTADAVGIGVENNKVIITIGNNDSSSGVWYYDHFTAEYSGDHGKDANDFTWQFVYNANPGTTNTHNVVIKDSAGTITTTNNVGIGTVTPPRRLSVSNQGAEGFEVGPGNVNGDASGYVTMVSYNRAAGAYVNNQWFASSFLLGTASVNAGLSISNSNQTTGQSVPLFLAVSNGTGNVSTTSIESVSNSGSTAADFYLRTGATSATGFGAPRLVVNGSTGNVGIGTTSPQRTLDLGTSGQLTFGNNGYSSTGSPGLFWYVDNTSYGIYKTAGTWNGPNYQQLMLNFPTGVVIDGGSAYGKSGTVLQPNGGNVGIGTPSPQFKLDVNGNTNVTGNITATGSIAAKYQDVAEWVPSSEHLSAGTVVVLDSTKSNQVTSSTVSYDTRVAGVVSEQPGIALGEKGEGKVLVATTGRVRVKVDATRGPIRIGDLLVTSGVPGLAMKSRPILISGRRIHAPGTLIGKALEPLAKGRGEILVLLSLQ